MTSRKLIKELSERNDMSQQAVRHLLDDLLAIVIRELAEGNKVHLNPNFGTFLMSKRSARRGVTPQGVEIVIPELAKPIFRTAKGFNDAFRY